MDWPVVGAVSGVGVLSVAVIGIGAYALLSGPSPARQQQIVAAINFSRIVGPTTFPIEDGLLQPDLPEHTKPDLAAPAPPRKGPATPPAQRPAASPPERKSASLPPNTGNSGRPPDPTQTLGTGASPQAPAAAQARWRVVKTAKAGMMNLGGHIDASGNVDGMANSHLRDALMAHANFSKLPPAMQAHIKNGTINLTVIAPYRGLLGIDDRKMEDEQGIKFVRA